MPNLILSIDDGHPLDLKLAEELHKLDLKCTFFIPGNNIEGRSVLKPDQITAISQMNHEIGSHTYNHVYLDSLSHSNAIEEISSGRKYLEDILAKPIRGFCFPGGRYNNKLIRYLKNNNYLYARTVKNFNFRHQSYIHNPTFQYYNHSLIALTINFLKQRNNNFSLFLKYITNKKRSLNEKILLCAINNSLGTDSANYFHLWSHSWEINELGMWNDYIKLITELKDIFGNSKTIEDICNK